MRLTQALSVVAAATFCLAIPDSAGAELVRIEVGSSARSGVPTTFEEARHRVERAGLAIAWVDGPYYEPYYSANGGATYASISTTNGADTVMVTWLEFDDEALAVANQQEIVAAYGTDSYMRSARAGRVVVQTYSHSADPASAGEVMSLILRR